MSIIKGMKSIKMLWQKVVLLAYAFLAQIKFSLAQDSSCDHTKEICNPIPDITSIPGLIQKILEGILKIGIPIVALAIIYAGFLFVAARGNSEKLSKAKDTLLYTLIGAAILLGSWAIAEIIEETVLAL